MYTSTFLITIKIQFYNLNFYASIYLKAMRYYTSSNEYY